MNSKGRVYNGSIKDGIPDGVGIMKYPNGLTYIGEFVEGKRNGLGKLSSSNGFSYEGMWLNDEMYGSGKVVYKDHKIEYDGTTQNGLPNGFGKLINNDFRKINNM